ncbi:anaphase-promoting complex subunit 4-like [Oppia nitens]|uniref:anaphase-promoting complex subunit 4-like n=1 Tax=Oppia nitens TaxID=1686743 RepID=UPI0023DBDA46|nr:anaphase-promoting complex subunit 4-like [Oppia nitens]
MVYFRCMDEISGHISGEIDVMKWNPKMDLIVFALKSADIVVHRLYSWQKIWHLPKPKLKTLADDKTDTTTARFVRDIEWRPDGKILAIAYECDIDSSDTKDGKSCLFLHDVETSKMLHKIVIDGKINCINWQQKEPSVSSNFNSDINRLNLSDKYSAISPFISLLPKANSVPKGFMRGSSRKTSDDNINDMMKVENQKTLNVLAIGTENGFIELYAFGVYKMAKFYMTDNNPIRYLALSSDLSLITAFVEYIDDECLEENITNSRYSMISYNLNVLKQRSYEILMISQIYAQSISQLSYLNETMREILEAWEDVMVEIDSKLSNYVSLQRSHSKSSAETKDNLIPLMADEFLELLVLGKASASLEKFLNDLTDKGLKKLGHSIELAYSNIQKLVVKNVERVLQHIYCHFNTLKGMALWEEKFGEVGLDIVAVNNTLKTIGSFLLKSTELQQVIDNSMRNVKAFIRWLYTAMVRLLDNEPSSQSELTKVSQQDIQFVTEFIKENFEFESSSNTSRPTASNFTLERVGQYLKDKDLTSINSSINDITINPWIQYLEERPNLTNTDPKTLYLYEHKSKTSFIGEHKLLDQSVRLAFTGPFNVITDSLGNGLRSKLSDLLYIPSNELLKVNHISNISLGYFYLSFINKSKPNKQMFIIRQTIANHCAIDVVSIVFYFNSKLLSLIDSQFYTENIITLLLTDEESNQSFLVQMPLNLLDNNFKPISGDFNHINSINFDINSFSSESGFIFRTLDNMVMFAVSGVRKVACLSFASKRRVRLFEMDVSEDDDEEQSEIMNDLNSSSVSGQSTDKSMSFKETII